MLKDIKNQFWVDVLKAYAEVLKLHKLDSEDLLLSNPIFYNHSINIGGEPAFIKKWYKNEVININNMINENGEFYSQEEFFNLKKNFLQFQDSKQAIKAYIKHFNITRFTKKLHYPIIPSVGTFYEDKKRRQRILHDLKQK